MSIASLLSIKVTSPITHMVSSAVRGVAASLLGKWLFHDIIKRFVHFLSSNTVWASTPILTLFFCAQWPCVLDCYHPRGLALVYLDQAPGVTGPEVRV